MIGLLQRVTNAQVDVGRETIGQIKQGLMVLIGVEKSDTKTQADKLLNRLISYRIFADEQGKMNLSLQDTQGGLLLVPQFTLPADTRKGRRPSFASAAPAELGKSLFEYVIDQAKAQHPNVAAGKFGADMQVSLTNDGPVTFWLQT